MQAILLPLESCPNSRQRHNLVPPAPFLPILKVFARGDIAKGRSSTGYSHVSAQQYININDNKLHGLIIQWRVSDVCDKLVKRSEDKEIVFCSLSFAGSICTTTASWEISP